MKRSRTSFRDDVVSMHREIFRQNRERINASVTGYTAAFRGYEARYEAGVRTYRRRVRPRVLHAALAATEIAYVGDYHPLARAQRGFLDLVRAAMARREVTLALEYVRGSEQPALDAYLAGKLQAEAFLARVDAGRNWPRLAWPGFRPILELARDARIPVVGIDSASRGQNSLERRDAFAAQRIAAAMSDRLMLVLVGELHVAPQHLPRAVDRACGRALGAVVVYQNCEEIYWQLEARGLEHSTDLVALDRQRYCLINTAPIVAQQAYLNWLEPDDDGLDAPADQLRDFGDRIARFFKLDVGDAMEDLEVATVVDLGFLRRLQRRADFSDWDLQRIHAQILSEESYFIPRARMVYLGTLSVNHAAEEATHYLRDCCCSPHEPRLLVDAFYARVLEEAIGFLGSKVINHRRKSPSLARLRTLARGDDPFERQVARLVLKHVRVAAGKRVRALAEIYECDADLFNAVTHVIGYQLGDQLYYALLANVIDQDSARELFYDPFAGEGEALATYLYLQRKVQSVVVPWHEPP
jgi:hypothetical protein